MLIGEYSGFLQPQPHRQNNNVSALYHELRVDMVHVENIASRGLSSSLLGHDRW